MKRDNNIKRAQDYYNTNKSEIQQKRKVKVKSDICNVEVNITGISTHRKSLKHIFNLQIQ